MPKIKLHSLTRKQWITLLGCNCSECKPRNVKIKALATYLGIDPASLPVSRLDPHKYGPENYE